MEKAIICGRPCVKRGKFWYAVRKSLSRADFHASRTNIKSNWAGNGAVHLGNNSVIVNQKTF